MRRTIPAGARALARYLDETGWRGATLVFGAMHDKDVERASWRRSCRTPRG